MTFVTEELINSDLTCDSLENIGSQAYYHIKWFIKEMALNPELKLCNVFSCNTFIVQLEKLVTDDHRIYLFEFHRED